MHRDKDIIIFSQEEQDSFSVPDMTHVDDAVAIAHAYSGAAGELTQRSIEVVDNATYDEDSGVLREIKPLLDRAKQLGVFSKGVIKLCPNEYANLLYKEAKKQLKQ